jgi:hypothetical protein
MSDSFALIRWQALHLFQFAGVRSSSPTLSSKRSLINHLVYCPHGSERSTRILYPIPWRFLSLVLQRFQDLQSLHYSLRNE